MSPPRWDDGLLDRMRQVGDPIADAAMADVFADGNRAAVQNVLNALRSNEHLRPAALPPAIGPLVRRPDVPEPEPAVVLEGQRLFADFCPEILLILACYSLPAAYAARRGVQVLYHTGFLQNRPNLRLFQTTQMVIDVMTRHGLSLDHGRGRVTALKVRLMHAAIRRLMLSSEEDATWPPDRELAGDPGLGVPINQEDLAGTLMTFTIVILNGLRKLDIPVTPAQADAYFAAWQVVARLLGIVEELIPATLAEAEELSRLIEERQIRDEPNPIGEEMTAALIQGLAAGMPGLEQIPAALMRFFLPTSVADRLGVRTPCSPMEVMVDGGIAMVELANRWAADQSRRLLLRRAGYSVVKLLFAIPVGGRRRFELPAELEHHWRDAQNA